MQLRFVHLQLYNGRISPTGHSFLPVSKEHRQREHPNVGITFVATNDTLVEWALAQDWIDVVIPYHLVRTGREVAKALNYTNYTRESSDVKAKEWSKGKDKAFIAPTEHNNDRATYMAALERNHLKPRFERFMNLPDGSPNPNYMKLVNETRQSAANSKPVQPVFDRDAAMAALGKLETNGYYQPIGGSVDRMYEIAAEVGEKLLDSNSENSYTVLTTDAKEDTGHEKGNSRRIQSSVDANPPRADSRDAGGRSSAPRGVVGQEEIRYRNLSRYEREALTEILIRAVDIDPEYREVLTSDYVDLETVVSRLYEGIISAAPFIEDMKQRIPGFADAVSRAEAFINRRPVRRTEHGNKGPAYTKTQDFLCRCSYFFMISDGFFPVSRLKQAEK